MGRSFPESLALPAMHADMPSMTDSGTGATRCDFLLFSHCRSPLRVITSIT